MQKELAHVAQRRLHPERAEASADLQPGETDFAGMTEEWVRWFPSDPPARQAAKLPVRIPGMKLSIAVIAKVVTAQSFGREVSHG